MRQSPMRDARCARAFSSVCKGRDAEWTELWGWSRSLGRSLCCLLDDVTGAQWKVHWFGHWQGVVVYAGGRWGLGFGLWAVVPGSPAGSKLEMGLSLFFSLLHLSLNLYLLSNMFEFLFWSPYGSNYMRLVSITLYMSLL